MGQKSSKTKVTTGEVENLEIFVELCAEGTLSEFWRACRRRPNLAVGDAACNNLKWLVETTKAKRGVHTQAILQCQVAVFNLKGR